MSTIYSVTFKSPSSPFKSYYQNQRRNISIRIFSSFEAAKQFAKSVDVISIYDGVGRKVNF